MQGDVCFIISNYFVIDKLGCYIKNLRFQLLEEPGSFGDPPVHQRKHIITEEESRVAPAITCLSGNGIAAITLVDMRSLMRQLQIAPTGN